MMLSKSQKRNLRKKQNRRLAGKGDYNVTQLMNDVKSVVKPAIKAALTEGGGAAGGLLASRLGFPAGKGNALGRDLGAKLSRLIGTGDYNIANETAVNSLIKARNPNPNLSFGGSFDEVRIRHREFIADVATGGIAGQFNNTVFPINPGLASTFPYLAAIAQNFEEYRFNGMVFEFVSTASSYLSASSMGSVIMSMEYNANAPAFTNKSQMENSDMAISCRLDKCMMYGVECNEFPQNAYMTRYSAATPLSTYDCGSFQIATAPGSTVATSTVIGELWVAYDVVLRRPRISPARFGYFHGTCVCNVSTTGANVFASSASTGTFVNKSAFGNLSASYMNTTPAPSVQLIDVNNGDCLLVTLAAKATYASEMYFRTPTVTSGLTIQPIYNGGSSTDTSAVAKSNQTQTGCTLMYLVTGATGSTQTITFDMSGVTAALGGTAFDVIITNVGNGLTASL